MKKHNFSAGPSILPASVFEKASQAVLELGNTGLSILEMSHRSKEFVAIMEEARALALELSGLTGKGYQALFLHGGASLHFYASALNLLERKGAYIDTGTWSHKALTEAQFVGATSVVASSRENGYRNIPTDFALPLDADYLHITTNNTIYGTEYSHYPEVEVPLVADMSSDIFSKEMPMDKFALIYAGAQKNIGAAGVTLVIVREDILGKVSHKIPTHLNYQVHIKNESMTNTPPTFAVYTCLLTMQWIKEQGGIKVIEERNKEKAHILYEEVDRNPLFKGYAESKDRSRMNVVFNLVDETLTDQFNALWTEAGISGIKGHRSVGGYRASIYNAMPIESVQLLVEVMKHFEKTV